LTGWRGPAARGAAVDTAGAHEGPTLISLVPGAVYRLNATLVLGPEHSHTTISSKSLPGGAAVISGARLLDHLKWEPVALPNAPKGVFKALVPVSVENIQALRVDGLRSTRARYPNANPGAASTG
jgi:hypothetical protein